MSSVTLRSMTEEEFTVYGKNSSIVYAKENVEAGRWPEEGALERAEKSFSDLLSEGLLTPNHDLFQIVNDRSESVGFTWLFWDTTENSLNAFIYDIEIYEDFRRGGYGKATMQAIETLASAKGARSIGLNVFHNNSAARALYEKAGYTVSSLSMTKHLEAH
jgi:ribosomal protein S18 acetylase RimI-like enzyme